jgi:hypothetical protein
MICPDGAGAADAEAGGGVFWAKAVTASATPARIILDTVLRCVTTAGGRVRSVWSIIGEESGREARPVVQSGTGADLWYGGSELMQAPASPSSSRTSRNVSLGPDCFRDDSARIAKARHHGTFASKCSRRRFAAR